MAEALQQSLNEEKLRHNRQEVDREAAKNKTENKDVRMNMLHRPCKLEDEEGVVHEWKAVLSAVRSFTSTDRNVGCCRPRC